jgi:beta-aspartyl-peptidase (threonine type)
MERTPHVMLIGKGVEDFAKTLPPEVGVKFQPDGYFCTERRWTQLEDVREMESRQKQGKDNVMMFQLDHASAPSTVVTIERGASKECEPKYEHDSHKFGTVGSVALYQPDPKSNGTHRAQLASATSTGGMTNQRYHRVGDSPVIGAGTYANSLCAVSCTGHGEWFIRCVAAHDVAKRLEYKYSDYQDRGSALKKAVDEVVNGSLRGDDENGGGAGGLIALDRDGNFYADMNCSGMYHAWLYENGDMVTRIFSDKKKECQNC